MKQHVVTGSRIILGLIFFVFGLNGFLSLPATGAAASGSRRVPGSLLFPPRQGRRNGVRRSFLGEPIRPARDDRHHPRRGQHLLLSSVPGHDEHAHGGRAGGPEPDLGACLPGVVCRLAGSERQAEGMSNVRGVASECANMLSCDQGSRPSRRRVRLSSPSLEYVTRLWVQTRFPWAPEVFGALWVGMAPG